MEALSVISQKTNSNCQGVDVWPCAVTGAVSAAAGFSDVGVVLNASSGCSYYVEYAVPATIHCTYLTEEEVVFGTASRLQEVVESVASLYDHLVVINSCVPALLAEDYSGLLPERTICIDAPGYCGDMCTGYWQTITALCSYLRESTLTHEAAEGVNIDGLCSIDRFSPGNLMEAKRLLGIAQIPIAAQCSGGSLDDLSRAAMNTVSVNPSFKSGVGTVSGSLLGLGAMKATFSDLAGQFPDADVSPLFDEYEATEEIIIKECDRYLRRHDPPTVGIFAPTAYADCAEELLVEYFDAEIVCNAPRDPSSGDRLGLRAIREMLNQEKPDLILGSSFEQAMSPDTSFVGITFPLRSGSVIQHRPLCGTEGALVLTERILHALTNTN